MSRLETRAALVWLALGLPLMALLVQLWPALHVLWTTADTYSHGYLVLAIALQLAVTEIRRRPWSTTNRSWFGLWALVVIAVAAFFAKAADVVLIEMFSIPALILAAAWALGGRALAQRLAIPAGFLFFGISVWDYLIEPLRAMTTVTVGVLARLTSIPVYIDGNTIYIPEGAFEVEGGCSGIRYAIVATALGVYWGLTRYNRLTPSLALGAVALGTAVLANWIRVYVIVLAGHLTDMQHAWVSVDHFYLGWGIFTFMMLLLFLAVRRYDGRIAVTDETSTSSGRGEVAVSPAPHKRPVTAHWLVAPIGTSVLLSAVVANAIAGAEPGGIERPSLVELPSPTVIGDWRLEGDWDAAALPHFSKLDAVVSGSYVAGKDVVDVYVGGYFAQRQGAELVYYANRPIPEQDRVLSSSRLKLTTADRASMPIRQLRVESHDGERRLVWVAYEVAGLATDRDLLAKLYQSVGALRGRRDAQAIVMSAKCAGDCEHASAALSRFTQTAAATLLDLVSPEAGSGGLLTLRIRDQD